MERAIKSTKKQWAQAHCSVLFNTTLTNWVQNYHPHILLPSQDGNIRLQKEQQPKYYNLPEVSALQTWILAIKHNYKIKTRCPCNICPGDKFHHSISTGDISPFAHGNVWHVCNLANGFQWQNQDQVTTVTEKFFHTTIVPTKMLLRFK